MEPHLLSLQPARSPTDTTSSHLGAPLCGTCGRPLPLQVAIVSPVPTPMAYCSPPGTCCLTTPSSLPLTSQHAGASSAALGEHHLHGVLPTGFLRRRLQGCPLYPAYLHTLINIFPPFICFCCFFPSTLGHARPWTLVYSTRLHHTP